MTIRTAADALARLEGMADEEQAAFARRFFRTGPGEYGEGDRLLGIRVPPLRRLAREGAALPAEETLALLRSPWHEARLLALLVLVREYARADEARQDAIHATYLAERAHVNSWDLVDLSAGRIVGATLARRGDWSPLDGLARSRVLWDRRIAMIATSYATAQGDVAPALHVAGLLVHDEHDLIHKAVGWMLREVGKRDRAALERFLERHAATMPRTMLRYAIERFGERARRKWMTLGADTGRGAARGQRDA